MESIVAIAASLMLIMGLAVSWILTVLGMPGNWLMVLLAAIFSWWIPSTWRIDISIPTLLTLIGLAAVGELVEFLAGAWGTRQAGGSRRAAFLALMGSVIGGLIGLGVGLPIPLIGPLVGVVLFAAAGATIGALLGERWVGQQWAAGWKVGKAAFWARLWGTAGKLTFGSVMVVVVLAALLMA